MKPKAIVTAALLCFLSPNCFAQPLKVFILAGQSNMQGHASISTFDSLANDPKAAPLLQEMRGPDGKSRVCEKVWISSVGCLGDAYSDLTEAKGKLTTGFGAPGNKVGPEFTFGLTIEKMLNEPVLIIKTSWGGRSLHTDFRPPSSGAFAWSETELADKKKQGEVIEKIKTEKAMATGMFYREMIAHVQMVLKDIKRVVPDYDEKQGCELVGFVWFQGFNDDVDGGGGVYPEQNNPGGYERYADLLTHFIRDVRKDLSAPQMPFVIGVNRQDQFARAMVHKLSTYALGRPMSFADRGEIDKMADELKERGNGLHDLVSIVIHSNLFSQKIKQETGLDQ